jgi:hypothetical protein
VTHEPGGDMQQPLAKAFGFCGRELAGQADQLDPADMAADGMTNRQIAQALFITIRTVTTHLGHTYQKPDIKSRTQLPDALNNPTTAAPRAALTH